MCDLVTAESVKSKYRSVNYKLCSYDSDKMLIEVLVVGITCVVIA